MVILSATMQRVRTPFLLSLPERAMRAVVAVAGGTVHETAQLVLPRFVRGSRLYEATAKNLLRVAIELVGRVAAPPGKEATGPGSLPSARAPATSSSSAR